MVFPSQFRSRDGQSGDFGSAWGSSGNRWFPWILPLIIYLTIVMTAATSWWVGVPAGAVMLAGWLWYLTRHGSR